MPDTTAINEQGPFHIDQVECVTCGACQAVAPTLIHEIVSIDGRSSYAFKRQPADAYETEQAIKTVHGCCVEAIYYTGDDPGILLRVSNSAVQHCHRIDTPTPLLFGTPTWKPVPRHSPQTIARIRWTLMILGGVLLASTFVAAVATSHLTNRSAAELYGLFLLGIMLASAGRKLGQ